MTHEYNERNIRTIGEDKDGCSDLEAFDGAKLSNTPAEGPIKTFRKVRSAKREHEAERGALASIRKFFSLL